MVLGGTLLAGNEVADCNQLDTQASSLSTELVGEMFLAAKKKLCNVCSRSGVKF